MHKYILTNANDFRPGMYYHFIFGCLEQYRRIVSALQKNNNNKKNYNNNKLKKIIIKQIHLLIYNIYIYIYIYTHTYMYTYTHYIAKSIGSPPSNCQGSVVCVMCSRLMCPYLVCFLSSLSVIMS